VFDPVPRQLNRVGRIQRCMTIDEELRRARFEMEHAEQGLMADDFPINQWILIKQYVGAAMLADRIEMLKAMSVMSTGGLSG
jgi:hypothetical protein